MDGTLFLTGGSGYIGRNLIRAAVARGLKVVALARSETSAARVSALGATPARGDILDAALLPNLMKGCRYLVHAAADTDHGLGSVAQARSNLEGTKAVFEAAKAAGITHAVQISTEAVLLEGRPLENANETLPMPSKPAGAYSRTKGEAERIALATAGGNFMVVAVRPRFVWGRDDTTALPALVDAAKSGKLQWIGGGRYLTSTTHVANACEGILLALEKGRSGEVYFVTDGEPVEFRAFVTRLLQTQSVAVPSASVPRWLVATAAYAGDALARMSGGRIKLPISYQEYATLGVPVTLDISKARRELGYAPIVSREQGLIELERKG